MMRPGALLLYIDNAAGGFTQVIERSSKKMNFQVIAGPFKHLEYSNEDLKTERFGYTSCFHTRVTIIMLKKNDNNQNKTQIPSQLFYPSQSVAASERKTPLRDVQNINEVPSQIRVAPSLRNKTQSPSKPSSSQSISASKRKAPLQDAQNTKKVPSQIYVIPPSSHNKTQSPLQPSHSTSASKRKAPIANAQNINDASSKMHAQKNINKSLSPNNSFRLSSSRSTSNGNVIRPSSNPSAAKMNNLNRQYDRFYPQVVTRPSTTPVSEPLITPSRSGTSGNTDEYSNDNCCACCVIS